MGGGGARSFAHIGVLRALEERGIGLDAVTGCSTAAFIAAMAAAGHRADEIARLLNATSFRKLVPARAGYGLFDQARLGAWFQQYLPERFEDLEIPLGVVSVDIQRGRAVRFTSGPLVRALLASHAFPGIFHPIEIEGRMLVDGGILDQVPVGLLRELSDAFMIAVEVHVLRDQAVILERKRRGLLAGMAALLRGRPPLPLRMMYKADAISRSALAEWQYEVYPPQMFIRPAIDDEVMVYDFGKLRETAEIGYREAVKALGANGLPSRRDNQTR